MHWLPGSCRNGAHDPLPLSGSPRHLACRGWARKPASASLLERFYRYRDDPERRIRSTFRDLLASFLGYRLTLGIGAIIFATAALIVLLSALRTARLDDSAESTS